MVTVSEVVFACHEKACAPPPAGKGGSLPGGGRGGRPGRQGTSQFEQEAIDRHAVAKAAWKKAKLHQDGTTNTANPGGLGGGSVGRKSNPTADAYIKGGGRVKSKAEQDAKKAEDKFLSAGKLAYARAAGKTKKGAKKRPNITYVNSQESG